MCATRQRPGEKPAPRGLRRKRWPILLAAGAALGTARAPAPKGSGLEAVAQINDASMPWDVASAPAIEALSQGAPSGATTLPVKPVSTTLEPLVPGVICGLLGLPACP
ncbi:hypothetical protein ACI797_02470 [Geodermatophilus sp. SYSU D00691]